MTELMDEVRGAVLRGWMAPALKRLDVDKLRAEAIAHEVYRLLAKHMAHLVGANTRANEYADAIKLIGAAMGLDEEALEADDLTMVIAARVRALIDRVNAVTGPVASERWAIVEIVGHRAHRGRIRLAEQFGATGVLIEEPFDDEGGFDEHFYPAASIFAVHDRTEGKVREWYAANMAGQYLRALPAPNPDATPLACVE